MRALLAVLVLASGCGKLFGIEQIPFAGDAGMTTLQLGATSYDFGSVVEGNSSVAIVIEVTNAGVATTGPLNVAASGDAPGDFIISSDGCTGTALAANATCAFNVALAPTAAGTRDAVITVADAINTASATFTGTGLVAGALQLSPSSVDFGTHDVGSMDASAVQTVTLTNTGGTTLKLVTIGVMSGGFSIATNGCTALSLAPHQSCTLDIRYSPTIGGPAVGSLVVTTDAPTGATSSASLGGLGRASVTVQIVGTGGTVMTADGAATCSAPSCVLHVTTATITLVPVDQPPSVFSVWSGACTYQNANDGGAFPHCVLGTYLMMPPVATADFESGYVVNLVPTAANTADTKAMITTNNAGLTSCISGQVCSLRSTLPIVSVKLTAVGDGSCATFQQWVGGNCSSAGPTCDLDPTSNITTIDYEFKAGNGSGCTTLK